MNPEEKNPSWSRLTELVRQDSPPSIDVSFAVMQAISRLPSQSPLPDDEVTSPLDVLSAWLSGRWLRGSLIALSGAAALVAYLGLSESDTVMLALGFSL